jgi:hypothetical protein
LIDDRAFVTGKRGAVLFAFQEILTDLRPDSFENKTNMGGQGVIAQDRVPRLNWIERSNESQGCANNERYYNLNGRYKEKRYS